MDQKPEDLSKGQEEENEYYYLENGLIVFTAAFLLARGYCCKRGCRHCPYGFGKHAENESNAPDH